MKFTVEATELMSHLENPIDTMIQGEQWYCTVACNSISYFSESSALIASFCRFCNTNSYERGDLWKLETQIEEPVSILSQNWRLEYSRKPRCTLYQDTNHRVSQLDGSKPSAQKSNGQIPYTHCPCCKCLVTFLPSKYKDQSIYLYSYIGLATYFQKYEDEDELTFEKSKHHSCSVSWHILQTKHPLWGNGAACYCSHQGGMNLWNASRPLLIHCYC